MTIDTKEASLFLVLSFALLAIFLTSSRIFSWADLLFSTCALIPESEWFSDKGSAI